MCRLSLFVCCYLLHIKLLFTFEEILKKLFRYEY